MKILHVLDGFFLAGIENQAYEIIRSYPEDNKSFLLNTSGSVTDTLEKFNLLKKQKKLVELKNIHSENPLQIIFSVRKYLKKNKIGALIVYPCHKKMIYIVLAAHLAGIKKIFISVQNVIYKKNKLEIFKIKILFHIFNNLDVCFVAASKSILFSMKRLNIKFNNYEVIYNSCDVKRINKIVEENKDYQNKEKVRTITMIARLDKIKDQETLIRAFSKINLTNWRLKIVGEGPQLKSLKRLAESLGLNPKDIFVGKRSDILNILSQTEIFAFSTTESEGFGIVLIEALAANLAVVASDVSACREILGNGKVGKLIPAADIDSWENTLRELMISEKKRENIKGNMNEFVKQFDSQKIVKKWFNLINL